MLKRAIFIFTAAAIAASVLCPGARAADESPANALLVVPSGTAFDKKFQDFLDKNGAKLLHSHPPSVFIGVIPPELDKQLLEKYGAQVYRDKVDDWASFARYGENAVFAVNAWNKRFLEDPPEAPLVVSTKVQKSGRKGDALKLVWNDVMKAHSYRLQISQDQAFETVLLETVVTRSDYSLVPAFWKDGVYYWRVAGIMTLNTGENTEGAFSEAYSFAISKPSASARPSGVQGSGPAEAPARLGAPKLPEKIRVKGRPLSWAGAAPFKYYRVQLSETPDFSAPLLDVFTDTCTYKLSGLSVKRDTPYYMRVMGSDGAAAGDWSAVSEVTLEAPGPVANDARRIRRRK